MAAIDLYVSVSGDRNILRNLDRMPVQIQEIVAKKMDKLAYDLADQVHANIAARLQRKTGQLENAVGYEVINSDGRVMARVFVDGTKAPYAAAQEGGATIPPHMIYPKNARVLSWMTPMGERAFAMRVSHPGAVLAPQHFLRDAYRQRGPKISREIKKAIVDSIRQRMRNGS